MAVESKLEDCMAEISLTHWQQDVYEPSDDSFLLVDALFEHRQSFKLRPPKRVVEIGSGSGYVITSFARLLQRLHITCQLLCVDHSTSAVLATSQTLANHKVPNVEIVQTDLLSGFTDALLGQVDVLIFNPPYVPTPDEEVHTGGITSAWAGGYRGRVVIDRLLQQLSNILAPGGELFMVTVAENDPEGIIAEMTGQGFSGGVVARRQADEETLTILCLRRHYDGASHS